MLGKELARASPSGLTGIQTLTQARLVTGRRFPNVPTLAAARTP